MPAQRGTAKTDRIKPGDCFTHKKFTENEMELEIKFMLTSKQRAQLRGLANGIDTIFQVGKGGVGETLIAQVNDALEARELIKLRTLETSPVGPREAAEEIAAATGAEVVAAIGTRFILYRPKKKDSKIKLVK